MEPNDLFEWRFLFLSDIIGATTANYTVRNQSGATAIGNLQITVNNRAPVANNMWFTTDEDTPHPLQEF